MLILILTVIVPHIFCDKYEIGTCIILILVKKNY